MYSIGVDFHKAYSHMTVMDTQGQVVKAGKVPNTVEAVQAFVAPYRDSAQAVVEATRNWTVMYDILEGEVGAVYLAHPPKGSGDCGSADQDRPDRLEDLRAPPTV